MKLIYKVIMMYMTGISYIMVNLSNDVCFSLYYRKRDDDVHFAPATEKSIRGFLWRYAIYDVEDVIFGQMMKYETKYISIYNILSIKDSIWNMYKGKEIFKI